MRETVYQVRMLNDSAEMVIQQISRFATDLGFEQRSGGKLWDGSEALPNFFRDGEMITVLMAHSADPPYLQIKYYTEKSAKETDVSMRNAIEAWLEMAFARRWVRIQTRRWRP